jgi:hypothetical protein
MTVFFALIAAPAAALELPGTCRVAFYGSSTLHDFDGTATCEAFVLTVAETPDGEGDTGAITLAVPVAGMHTGIERRDRTMREMFEAGRFPKIVGSLSRLPLAERRQQLHQAAREAGPIPLLLRIRDRELPVSARVTGLVDTDRTFTLDLEFPVSLAAFNLAAPAVLGFIRVADEVKIKVSVLTAPLPGPWPSPR